MQLFESITAIPAITVLCLLITQIAKCFTPLNNKHLPVLCGTCGAILGFICDAWFPGYIPVENSFAAVAIGVVSGWAATGIHQVYKQETKQ